jgi:hypothetical protein
MASFVLVHGAWHGPWVWDKLRASLAARGHESVAPELPVDDGTATWTDWADAVQASMADVHEPVLVAHSLAGVVAPIVASRVPLHTLVFLASLVPNREGNPWADAPEPASPGTFAGLQERPDGSTMWTDLDNAIYTFYEDLDRDEAAACFTRLRPQNGSSLWDRPYPLEEWPRCRMVSVYCDHDRAVGPEYARYVARERLGVEPVEFPGDHSPFLSRPDELADFLIKVTLQDRTQ